MISIIFLKRNYDQENLDKRLRVNKKTHKLSHPVYGASLLHRISVFTAQEIKTPFSSKSYCELCNRPSHLQKG